MASYEHQLSLSVDSREHTTVVTIVGNIDSMTADDLQNRLLETIQSGQTQLVADMSGVTYTSSAGLRALLAGMKQARSNGGDLRLAAVTDKVHKVLQLSGFTTILRLYPDVNAAVASYGQ